MDLSRIDPGWAPYLAGVLAVAGLVTVVQMVISANKWVLKAFIAAWEKQSEQNRQAEDRRHTETIEAGNRHHAELLAEVRRPPFVDADVPTTLPLCPHHNRGR